MNHIKAEINAICSHVIALLNNPADPLEESQREVVQSIDQAAHDLMALWIPDERYFKLPPEERSRWQHELGNPINGLLGLSELMLMEPLSERQDRQLREINRLGQEIYSHVKSLRVAV